MLPDERYEFVIMIHMAAKISSHFFCFLLDLNTLDNQISSSETRHSAETSSEENVLAFLIRHFGPRTAAGTKSPLLPFSPSLTFLVYYHDGKERLFKEGYYRTGLI